MDTVSAFVEVNRTRLFYETGGEGHPIVFLHGFSLDGRMWEPQFAAFTAEYCCLRYDLRGFGRSELPGDESYSHAEDLWALLDHLEVPPAVLVGLSKGAAVALDFALAYPGRTRGLVLIDPVVGGFPWSQENTSRDRLVWDAARSHGIPAGKAAWLAHSLFAPAMQNPRAADQFRRMVEDYSGWHFTHRDPEIRPAQPAYERLEQIRLPVLVMVGELDLPDFLRSAAAIHQRVPACRKLVIAAAGHLANMEQPEAVNRHLAQWLRFSLPPAGPSRFVCRC